MQKSHGPWAIFIHGSWPWLEVSEGAKLSASSNIGDPNWGARTGLMLGFYREQALRGLPLIFCWCKVLRDHHWWWSTIVSLQGSNTSDISNRILWNYIPTPFNCRSYVRCPEGNFTWRLSKRLAASPFRLHLERYLKIPPKKWSEVLDLHRPRNRNMCPCKVTLYIQTSPFWRPFGDSKHLLHQVFGGFMRILDVGESIRVKPETVTVTGSPGTQRAHKKP